jgi:hypothetical protein
VNPRDGQDLVRAGDGDEEDGESAYDAVLHCRFRLD